MRCIKAGNVKLKYFRKTCPIATLRMKNLANCPDIKLDLHIGMPALN
jgi:hypothetical protein